MLDDSLRRFVELRDILTTYSPMPHKFLATRSPVSFTARGSGDSPADGGGEADGPGNSRGGEVIGPGNPRGRSASPSARREGSELGGGGFSAEEQPGSTELSS